MSIQNITFRCDHPGCVETTDALALERHDGWSRVETSLYVKPPVVISFDFFPNHAHLHTRAS